MKRYVEGYNDDYYVFKLAYSEEEHYKYMRTGFNHIYKDQDTYKLYTYDGYITLNKSVSELFENCNSEDVFSIDSKGIVYEQYNSNSDDNALVLTLQCNSNCVMCPCSENSRKHSQLCSLTDLKELLRYFPKSPRYLTITGGEPSLLNEDFFGLMRELQYGYDETYFLLLTNGRAWGDYSFTKRFMECIPDNIRIGIPIYGYCEETHDSITQAPGSFKQTVIGIHNLLHYNVEVEIRVVLTKHNIDYIEKVARYIAKYFQGVHSVNFMGLEMLGNAAKNKEKVWLPYEEMFIKSEKAIRILIANGIDVQLFNLPLCAVKKEYWGICAKSISDYKVRYSEECQDCDVKEICGGVFDSTKRVANFKGTPIKR